MMIFTNNDAILACRELFPEASNAIEIQNCHGHQVFIVDTGTHPEKVALRFGNDNDEAKHSLSKEIRVMNLLQEKGIPVPKVIYHDTSRIVLEQEYMILSFIEGEDLDKVFYKMDKREQSSIAYQLGVILGKMHSIRFDEYGYLTSEGIYGKSFSVKNIGKGSTFDPCIKQALNDSLHDLGNLFSIDDINHSELDKVYAYLAHNKNLAQEFEKPSLIHGDFDLRNIRVKKTPEDWIVTGILDFELSASHTKEYDFIKMHRFGLLKLEHFREPLMEGYMLYQKIHPHFHERISYFRAGRDIGFIFILYRAGNKKLAEELLSNLLYTISEKKS